VCLRTAPYKFQSEHIMAYLAAVEVTDGWFRAPRVDSPRRFGKIEIERVRANAFALREREVVNILRGVVEQ
jgi:hypothetical protein